MLIIIVHYPPVKEGKDAEFREWFAWSNELFAKHKGFIGRKLLEPVGGGNYAAVVEHESRETFTAMHSTPEHDEAGRRVKPLLDGNPVPQLYEVIVR